MNCSECKYHFKISVCNCGKCPTLEGYVCLFPHIEASNYQCTYKETEAGLCELFTSRKAVLEEKQCLDDIKNELILQEKKGNLLNGAGVYLMVLVDRAEKTPGFYSGEDLVAQERKACIEICRNIAALYPTDIFPEDGKSLDCKSARMARLTATNIEQKIRERGI